MKVCALALTLLLTTPVFAAPSRLKDITTVKGVRENPVIGYGLVIGLNGTGDAGGEITNSSLKKMFEKLGLNPKSEITSKNVAAVVVTGKLPPFARVGQKIDLVVSSIGDASSLAGGTLLVTPLKAGDGNIYAVASGPLSIGGLKKGAKFATTATLPSGATVEREVITEFEKKNSLRLSLNIPDFTTAARVEKVINEELGGKFASAKDSTTIDLVVPNQYERNIVQLMAIIENFKVNTDSAAKIVINERTGTIVAGGDVMVKPVAISHGDLTIEVKGEGDAKAAKPGSVYYMEKGTTLSELVKSLNAFGVAPEDLISIFQTLKRDGALVGEIELI
ncbi:flagellar basal body P-ring protein FlgI [Bacteriovorax stolpii]|uniref:Flagellar P-ring protein n=1 Tax=Bacteriovorax stolpii TaxID=960 RepID=A0A2K9NWZ2_BACTC|nr:flagellar basal body P-ring protein FlgI [Bacteriovorax stolpii]AUO00027.1 flagellar biosynthesis protein FlgA [Bacteriovorax stolpii]QDK39981.1 flagellar basal body P-ring protein FlgI [Bacteriovorax stolpii]TDP54080.1 flagellar P-ring protein precursor FlgI [Bacteriovorax stolpii]BDT30218.1 flagellar basal body P-ring protein FlgI [Bacteriovorax sp. HI3]